ncbi:biotin-dependent carboxyltransferase family protein [Desulfatiferula olefinivorans]
MASMSMLEVIGPGLFCETGPPVYGHQDRGVSPGGPMDLFSFETGRRLLGGGPSIRALEMILPPRLRFGGEAFFVLTGAAFTGVRLCGASIRQVDHGRVHRALPGDILEFGEKRYGFRTCLCYEPVSEHRGRDCEGRVRGAFADMASWPDPQGRIRVMAGPEYGRLNDPDDFFRRRFTVSPDSNAMGLRLIPPGPPPGLEGGFSMVSDAVADGTVQLTPAGPVILMRRRQTLGGYPRIFNVITADLDTLAQIAPGEGIRFRRVDRTDALSALARRHRDLEAIEDRYDHDEA